MINKGSIERETDVLVVGGGGAGARAALEASRAGADVILCSKAPVGEAGATAYRIVELAGFNVWNKDSEGTVDDYHRDIIEAGLGMCDPELARILSTEADSERRFLESIGVEFQKIGNSYLSFTGCFASRQRTLILEGHGHVIMQALSAELRKSTVTLFEDSMIIDLIVLDGRVAGAVGIDGDGTIFTVRASSVILCSGGAGRMFSLNMNPADITGDGYALGYRAGAVLTNMEFMQFGLATVYPSYNLIGNWLFPLHPVLRDREGNSLLDRNLPEGLTLDGVIKDKQKHFPFTSRDRSKYIEISVQQEMAAGRTTPNGGVYLDFTDVARREADLAPNDRKVWDMARGWLAERGIDVSTTMLEIGVFAHASNGGVLIGANGESSVPGLFAAGENAAGPHGADRLGGNMLVTSQVFGRRAGQAAAASIAGSGNTVQQARFAEAATDLIHEHFPDTGARRIDSATIGELRGSLAATFGREMILLRSEKGYQRCRERIEEITDRLGGAVPSAQTELRSLAELQNMCTTGRLMIEAGIRRRESRGGYYRVDYPQQDDRSFLHNILLRRESDRLTVSTGSIADRSSHSDSYTEEV